MNACVRWAPMIGAREGELSDEEARGLAEHLATCDACQARLADDAALSGMLPEALLREANQRDFSRFSDEVLERIPAYRERRGWLAPLGAWVRHHRVAAAASVLAPAMAAAALVVYLGVGGTAPEPTVDVSSETGGAMVLETKDGPVVLFGDQGEGM
jgi:anti-sigma factor RsiW